MEEKIIRIDKKLNYYSAIAIYKKKQTKNKYNRFYPIKICA